MHQYHIYITLYISQCNSIVGIIVSFAIYILILFSPTILDTIFPLNETRPHLHYASTEYFVDSKVYYYPILCHWLICELLCIIIAITTTTNIFVYFEHICGLLKIAR